MIESHAPAVTVLTAAYNRRHCLPILYDSLARQTNKDFQWLIIDDGSFDDTREYLESLPQREFPIEYHWKENGGKHTALNFSHPYILGDFVFMVDSDDYLEDDAIETLISDWEKYKIHEDIGVLSYRKRTTDGELLSRLVEEPLIKDDIEYRVNHRISGDRCEVIRTELFKRYPFPEFENEKFMGEGWLFRHIAYSYKTVYLNRALYICEYLEGGLSASGRALRMRCPYGMMENSRSFFHRKVCVREQMKQEVAFWTYGKCAGLSIRDILKLSGRPLRMIQMFPIGLAVYYSWRKRFLEG